MEQVKPAEGKLREMQLKTLDVLLDIDNICKQHNIKYSLWAGSIIGAVVHKGFIPWDDDIDLVMDRENFKKFRSVCMSELPKHLEYKDYFTDNSSYVLISKIIDKNTTCVMYNQQGDKIISGVFVDITVLDNIPKSKIKAFTQNIVSKMNLLYVNKYAPQNHGKLAKLIGNILLKIVPNSIHHNIVKYGVDYISGFDKASSKYLDQIIYPSERINLDINILDKFIYVDFEGFKFPVFDKYHEYLIKRYKRDYTVLPPEDERNPQHNVEYINCNIGYKEYIENLVSNG